MDSPLSLHENLFQKWQKCVAHRALDQAAQLDFAHYEHLVKKTEKPEFWELWQNQTLPFRQEIAAEFTRYLPARSPTLSAPDVTLLVYHNYSGLAHETQLARNIQHLRRSSRNFDVHIAYAFGPRSDEFHAAAAALHQVPMGNVHFMKASGYLDLGMRLSALDNALRFNTVIYPSIAYLGFWGSLVFPHPNQKFQRMKYRPRQAGRLTQYADGRFDNERIVMIHGEPWLQLAVLQPGQLPKEGRQSYRGLHATAQTFGSISRAEKSTDPSYQNFVLELLERHGSMNYLFTGHKQQLQLFDPNLTAHPRAHFMGWVNPLESIWKFSIYLETFPWGGGDMSILAVEAGLPYLILGSEQNKLVGIYHFLRHAALRSGQSILNTSFCDDLPTLRERFSELVQSPDLRFSLSQAWQRAIETYEPDDMQIWDEFLTR